MSSAHRGQTAIAMWSSDCRTGFGSMVGDLGCVTAATKVSARGPIIHLDRRLLSAVDPQRREGTAVGKTVVLERRSWRGARYERSWYKARTPVRAFAQFTGSFVWQSVKMEAAGIEPASSRLCVELSGGRGFVEL